MEQNRELLLNYLILCRLFGFIGKTPKVPRIKDLFGGWVRKYYFRGLIFMTVNLYALWLDKLQVTILCSRFCVLHIGGRGTIVI